MEFFAVNGKRPIRSSEETRRFAYESVNRKYGIETWENQGVALDDIAGYESMSSMQRYDAAIERVVKTAPLRICENEKISGAATYGIATKHYVPATFNGKNVFYSASHLTVDFETVLKKGVKYIESQAKESLAKYKGTERESFLQSCLNCLGYMHVWHSRYLEALKEMPQYKANYENLKNVPFEPASSFYEAVQSIWFTFAFLRLCGNWPGIGRLDWLLGEYLDKDLAENRITIDEAHEILAHFFIKGCEWVRGGDYGSGDAQHYQNIVLGGIDENGREVTNTVTYLVLDIIEEFGISDFPTTVRINANTDERLLTRVSEVIRYGGGVVAVYNETLIIDSLVKYGYDLREARKFANDGCWEVQVPGKTFFTYIPFDGLQILQQKTLKGYDKNISFDGFEGLYNAYIKDLSDEVFKMIDIRNSQSFASTDGPTSEWKWNPWSPATVISLFEQGCIEKGLSYFDGGPIYNVVSPHIGGLPDVVNSLYAIKKLVLDDGVVTFSELMEALKNGWEGNEPLRQYAINNVVCFGNDNDEVDCIASRIVNDFADICDEASKRSAYMTPAGISTFGRQLEWSVNRLATPYGKNRQSVLAGNFSPTPGTDKEGATAIIRSYCKSDLTRTVSGAALDIKLLPSAVNGANGAEAIAALIRGFVALGGHFMQLDIADTALLKAAQERPEEYLNLSVRVSGWNARFVTLNREWQDMIIAQTGSEF